MNSTRARRSRTELQVEQKEIKVGHKYECRFNNDPDEKMVSCITKEKKADGTWLVQYSGKSTQVIVDECNISATNGNVFVPHSTPERGLKKAAKHNTKGPSVERVVFKDTPVVVAIEKTNVVAPTQGKSTSEGLNVMGPVNCDTPFDLMKEIQREGKFQLRNNERFKELAIMKLKEPEEGWVTSELEEWLSDMECEVAPLAPDQTLCDWIMAKANARFRTLLKRTKRMKEDEPALEGNENEKEKVLNDTAKVSEKKVEEEDIVIQKASPNKAASSNKPVALKKLNTRIKLEGDETNDKYDQLPSLNSYVVALTKALYAGPDTEDEGTNGYNRSSLRNKIKGTVRKNQEQCLKGYGANPTEAFAKALF